MNEAFCKINSFYCNESIQNSISINFIATDYLNNIFIEYLKIIAQRYQEYGLNLITQTRVIMFLQAKDFIQVENIIRYAIENNIISSYDELNTMLELLESHSLYELAIKLCKENLHKQFLQ